MWETTGSIPFGNCADLCLLQPITKLCPYEEPDTCNPNANITPYLSHRFQLQMVNSTELSASLLSFRFFHLLPFPQLSRKGFKPNSCLPHQTPTARAYKGKPSSTSSSGGAEKLNNVISRGRLEYEAQQVKSSSSTFPPVGWPVFSPFPELHVF